MALFFTILGGIVALGAAVAAIPKIWQALRWTYHLLRRVDEISRLGPVIVGMAQQFQRNGGASMRDAVAAIKEDVASVKEDVGGVKQDVGALKEQTSKQDDVLEAIAKRQDTIAEWQSNVDKVLARLVLHEANNDLHRSRLREEAERKLGPPDALKIEVIGGETPPETENH